MKLINDDCLKVLPTLTDKSVDLIITSPPYDNMRVKQGHLLNKHYILKILD